MRTITHSQMALVNDYMEKGITIEPQFKAGDSVMMLHEWAIDNVAACAMALTRTTEGKRKEDARTNLYDLKMFLLLEVF